MTDIAARFGAQVTRMEAKAGTVFSYEVRRHHNLSCSSISVCEVFCSCNFANDQGQLWL
jgi:hypothetical protein